MAGNIGGFIFAVVLVVIADVQAMSTLEGGKFAYLLLSVLHIPLVFLGYLVGNGLRKMLHPDAIIAYGFWGLLKEKIFWKIGPQTIGACIVLAIAVNFTQDLVYNPDRQKAKETASRMKDTSQASTTTKPQFAEQISREEFIKKYVGNNQVIETDISRLNTLIKRGNKYFKLTGLITSDNWRNSTPNISEFNGLSLDLSDAVINGEITISGFDTIILGNDITNVKSIEAKYVYIPNSVTRIGDGMFYNSDLIEEIIIPASVTEIGSMAFNGCTALKRVYFSRNAQLKIIERSAFSGCENLTRIDIPDSVTIIGNNAFWRCESLGQLNLMESSHLETIGEAALYGTNIVKLYLPSSVKEIGRSVTEETPLTVVTITALTPPQVSQDSFPKTIQKIYVPKESLKLYEEAWFDYEFTFNNQLTAIK
jgi:hypothetical protein